MTDHPGHPNPPRKPRWRRWGFWGFVLANVAALLLIIPLLKAVGPLARIWWNTRSQESYQASQESPSTSETAAQQIPPGPSPTSAAPPADAAPSMSGLTNGLGVIANLDSNEINAIIETQFGKRKPAGDPTQFDADSAVFDKITRRKATIEGKEYFCYEIDLVDENGNHKVQVDCFEEPNLDYERSIQVLDLVRGNPQLKKIYEALGKALPSASSNSSAESDPSDSGKKSDPGPVFRFEPSGSPNP